MVEVRSCGWFISMVQQKECTVDDSVEWFYFGHVVSVEEVAVDQKQNHQLGSWQDEDAVP